MLVSCCYCYYWAEGKGRFDNNGLPILRNLADSHKIFMGSAASYEAIYQNPNKGDQMNYTLILGSQFSMITPENSMKWQVTEPQQNVFNYSTGDTLLKYAVAHNQSVRGHNLCWGESNPSWLTNGNFSAVQLKAILKNHIQNVVTYWKGKLYSWDVVNEAFDSNGQLRTNLWYPAIPNYIDLAFQYAAEADSNVKLFYNDWGGEGMNNKSDAIYNYIQGMKSRGIKIDGIGLESHFYYNVYPPPAQVVQNMNRLGELGLEVHVTEMDVGIGVNQEYNLTRLAVQANIFGGMLQACLTVGPRVCKNFEMWGFTSEHSWVSDSANVFHHNYQPKPSFWKLAQTLNSTTTLVI